MHPSNCEKHAEYPTSVTSVTAVRVGSQRPSIIYADVCARKHALSCFLMHHHFDIVHRRYGVKPRCAGGAGYSPPPVNATCAALLRTLCPHVAPPYDCNGWSDVYPPLNKSFACSAGCLQNKNVTNALRKVSRTSSAVVPRSACRILRVV